MLVLNPWRYSQGAVQQLRKCQGAQEVISLVPKAPWKWYIVARVAWGLMAWCRKGSVKMCIQDWGRPRNSKLATLAQETSRFDIRGPVGPGPSATAPPESMLFLKHVIIIPTLPAIFASSVLRPVSTHLYMKVTLMLHLLRHFKQLLSISLTLSTGLRFVWFCFVF